MIQSPFRARILAASVFAAAAFAPGAALACNPIQFLFGGCRPQPTPQPQPTLENMIDRNEGPVVKAKRKPSAGASSSHGTKQAAISPPAGASVGSVAHFSEDKTLRRGDVVVTPDGFLVYRGGSGAHTRDNFEPLTKARDELANLERASRNPGAAYAPVAVADAAPAVAKASPRKPKPQSKAAAPKTIEPKTVEPKDFEAKVSE